MPEEKCPEFAALEAKAHAILKKLQMISTQQLEAFDRYDDEKFANFDRELENTVGEKERAIGALRQHAAEHGCQPEFLPDQPDKL